jgi:uncharacterized protein (DUF983 family)
MKKLLKKIINWLRIDCPECYGKLHQEFFDMQYDKLVWKCDKCGKQFI